MIKIWFITSSKLEKQPSNLSIKRFCKYCNKERLKRNFSSRKRMLNKKWTKVSIKLLITWKKVKCHHNLLMDHIINILLKRNHSKWDVMIIHKKKMRFNNIFRSIMTIFKLILKIKHFTKNVPNPIKYLETNMFS